MTTYTTNVPAARAELLEIAERLRQVGLGADADRIAVLCRDMLTRKPSGRRATTQRRAVTPEIEAEVKHLLFTTRLPQEDIARMVGIDGGRVSEILNRALLAGLPDVGDVR